jgi:peptidoglycan/xylan/chitin deacetylase (PgdA/CDA1 family)
MLLILMFHRISEAADPSVLQRFEHFVMKLRATHCFVLPGDPLPPRSLSVCLTFDDGYYDFYRLAFPFLRSHGIKSVLAVPTQYIIEETRVEPEDRLRPMSRLHGDEPYDGSFLCTWQELRELYQSGLVSIASHGHTHTSLRGPADFETELLRSREFLETRLGASISTFVYPFGHFDSTAHAMAMARYEYVMRIGSALNFGWGGSRRLLYRVNADPFWREGRALSVARLCGYGLNWVKNRARNR